MSGGRSWLYWGLLLIVAGIALVSGALFGLTYRLALNVRQQEIAHALAEINDMRAIGPLIEAMSYEGAQAAVVRDTLIRLLYRVTPSNAGTISPPRRLALYSMLNESVMNDHAKAALCGAILTAMEQMGDRDALPYVQRLAQSSPWTPAQHAVCKRANECLMYWNASMAQARTGTTLLRASASPTDSPQILLRPADTNDADAHSQLLRPADNTNSPLA